MIAALEVHDLLAKMYSILDNVVSKWVDNLALILANLFNSAPQQHHEVWTSQFLSLQSKNRSCSS